MYNWFIYSMSKGEVYKFLIHNDNWLIYNDNRFIYNNNRFILFLPKEKIYKFLIHNNNEFIPFLFIHNI